VPTPTTRARPLRPDERRADIIAAVTPLLIEHGGAVTSRQLADAAGVAEGTVFRAFGDKDSLIRAALDAHRDPALLWSELDGIDAERDAATAITRILALLTDRLSVIVPLSIAVHRIRPAPDEAERERHHDQLQQRSRELTEHIAGVLQPHASSLAASPEVVAGYLRMVATAAAMPHLHPGDDTSVGEIAALVLDGVVRR